jgi:hypothetical protein
MSEQLKIFSEMEMLNVVVKGISNVEALKRRLSQENMIEAFTYATRIAAEASRQPRGNYIICSPQVAEELKKLNI